MGRVLKLNECFSAGVEIDTRLMTRLVNGRGKKRF